MAVEFDVKGTRTSEYLFLPEQFLAACGVPKVYRDGTRPE